MCVPTDGTTCSAVMLGLGLGLGGCGLGFGLESHGLCLGLVN